MHSLKRGSILAIVVALMSVLRAQTLRQHPDAPLPGGVEGQAGLRFVDINGDGHEDIVFSNSERYGVYLFNDVEKKGLGWTYGWPHLIREGKAGDANALPLTTGDDVTFKDGAMWLKGAKAITFAELCRPPTPPPRTPEESLRAIHVKKGFKVELVAQEPLVQDPIFIDWDAKGRMWVVEMGDYPFHGRGGKLCSGRVKILESTHGDGIYDKATLFLDKLQYPTGLAPWKNGVFIASVPDVSFVEEHDGKPGKRTPILSGFTLGNPQHLVNGFCWGLDGWFYGGNGDSGGKVVEVKSGKVFDLSGRDYRFNPMTGEFQLQAGKTQYGRWRDDFGNWFGCNNSSMGWHYFMDERYLARNPKLAVPSLRRVLNKEPDTLRIFPVSAPMRRFNQPDAVNTLTSGCNAMPYRDTLFGEEYAHSFFICEPANNLVHREVLEPDGISFRSHRAADEKDHEFLASEDNWSRFTMARTGPDGCLYVVDMYRLVLEHPEWIPKQTIEHLDLRAGEDKGRIYRISPEGLGPRKVTQLDKMSDVDLASQLRSDNGWIRDTGQRLLVERQAFNSKELMELMAMSHAKWNDAGYAQYLHTVSTAGGGKMAAASSMLVATTHPTSGRIREAGVLIAERYLGADSAFVTVSPLANDPDLRVRVQVALTLGESSDPRAPDVLRALAKRDGENPDMLIALLTAYPKHEAALAEDAKVWQARLKELLKNNAGAKAPLPIITNNNPDRDKVVKQYTPAVPPLKGDLERGHALYKNICAACHKLKNEGTEIGPDLGTVAAKPVEQLLEAILDPSRAVEQRYLATTITTQDGKVIVGMIAEETANSITLKLAGVTEVILRSNIAKRESSTKSLMPDGMESLLSPQAVADVIAWMRK